GMIEKQLVRSYRESNACCKLAANPQQKTSSIHLTFSGLKGVSELASTALQRQLSGKKTRKVVKRRRTKGPSEKIRSLAALSLSAKVAYLKIGDLIGADEARAAALINERLPRRNYKKGETVYPSNQKGPVLFVVKSGSINIGRRSVTGSEFDVKSVEPGAVFGEMPVMGQSMHGA